MSTSAADIDVNLINQSLAHVNTFSRRRQAEKLQPVLMYEIPSQGESQYRTCTLRELLAIIHTEATHIDDMYWTQKHTSSSAEADKDINVVSSLRLRDLRRLDYAFNPNEEKVDAYVYVCMAMGMCMYMCMCM
ncbi:hypothetical protein EON64_10015 [archaeon]|nr:MAG: hypothetical protein EON64_10015 [archaeon]